MAQPEPGARRHRTLLALAALGCVALQVGQRLDLAAASLVVWLVVLFAADRKALDRLRMPRFWIVTLLFALGSGLLLGRRDFSLGPIPLSRAGMEAGALMVLRGAFVFALASWASRAVGLGEVYAATSRLRLGSLGLAVAAAFQVLPQVRDRLAGDWKKPRGLWARVWQIAILAIREACSLADELAAQLRLGAPARLLAVAAPPGVGKTTTLLGIATELRRLGVTVGGVLQPAIDTDEGRTAYELRDAATGEERPFARRGKTRGYEFDDEGWDWAAERLASAHREADVVVVDELGRLEAEGKGHMETLRELCERPGRAAVLVAAIREESLEAVASQLGEPWDRVPVPSDRAAWAEWASRIAAEARRARSRG